MADSKAEFRATRERVGLTQKALAVMMGVDVRTVKRWEEPELPDPPKYAQDRLQEALEAHTAIVQAAIRRVDAIVEQQGRPPASMCLTYYRSQAQYDRYGRDRGDFNVINARSREIGALLRQRGITVSYAYPDGGDTGVFEALKGTR